VTLPRPHELDDDRGDIEGGGLFEVVDVEQYDWEIVYDADGYIDLLNTFSGPIAMEGLATRPLVRRGPAPSR